MNHTKLLSIGLVLLLIGSMLTESDAQRSSRRRRRGILRRVGGIFRYQQRRNEAEETEARRACFAMSALFTRRGCASEVNAICRMYAFGLKNSDYECEQFPCSGYGSDSRSVCVPQGTCTRVTLSNGLCTQGAECCIP